MDNFSFDYKKIEIIMIILVLNVMNKAKKKEVKFSKQKPFHRHLAHVPKSSKMKKLWSWFIDEQSWVTPQDYFIHENYQKLETESDYTRPQILCVLRTQYQFMTPQEKQPFIEKSRMKFKRDPEGIGYIAGEATLEEQKQFLMKVIQKGLNARKNKYYETCKNCNPNSYCSEFECSEQCENEMQDFESLRALNLKKKEIKVLEYSLVRAQQRSTLCEKIMHTCTLCNKDIWSSSWYVKSIMHHQQNVDYFMMTKFNCLKILNGIKVEWCEREIVQVLNDIIAVATKL